MSTTMAQSATVQLRVSPDTKDLSFNVFKKHGFTLTDGIRIYLERVAQTGEIPLSVNIPNEQTAKILSMPDSEKGYQRFDNLDELFADLKN